jgi:large conductance mechanosensitive channel
MLDGFKKFILRGNVVDMAVGVVIGAAFGGVVTEMTKAFLTPFIALVVGKPDYSNLKFVVRGTEFPIGEFINACISFILIAATVYFFVVLPINALIARMHRGESPPIPPPRNVPSASARFRSPPAAAPTAPSPSWDAPHNNSSGSKKGGHPAALDCSHTRLRQSLIRRRPVHRGHRHTVQP